jgi:hypothetical protein
MKQLKVSQRRGYSAEHAFEDLNFNVLDPLIKGANSTRSWIRAGKPVPGSDDFLDWAEAQLAFKTRGQVGYGCYIVIDKYMKDVRIRPYAVYEVHNNDHRRWKTVHQVRTDDFEIVSNDEKTLEAVTINSIGKVIGEYDTKSEAMVAAKRYIAENKKNCSIVRVKITDEAPIEAYCVYKPSSNAKIGTFVAFGYVDE